MLRRIYIVNFTFEEKRNIIMTSVSRYFSVRLMKNESSMQQQKYEYDRRDTFHKIFSGNSNLQRVSVITCFYCHVNWNVLIPSIFTASVISNLLHWASNVKWNTFIIHLPANVRVWIHRHTTNLREMLLSESNSILLQPIKLVDIAFRMTYKAYQMTYHHGWLCIFWMVRASLTFFIKC